MITFHGREVGNENVNEVVQQARRSLPSDPSNWRLGIRLDNADRLSLT